MAVREFNGTSDRIVVDNGIVGQIASGAFTMLVVVKPTALGAGGEAFMSCQTPSANICALYDNSGGQLAWGDADDYIVVGGMGLSASVYQIVAVTKTAGTTAPRLHRKAVDGTSSGWTHSTAGTSSDGNTTAVTEIEFGSTRNGAFTSFKDMRLAVAALWDSALSDANLETIVGETLQIDALNPIGLWDFNQASTGTAVVDLTGNGADQTTISGTTVITVDDPTWVFGISAPQEIRPDADTTTTGWTTTPLFSKINDESDATVITATAS